MDISEIPKDAIVFIKKEVLPIDWTNSNDIRQVLNIASDKCLLYDRTLELSKQTSAQIEEKQNEKIRIMQECDKNIQELQDQHHNIMERTAIQDPTHTYEKIVKMAKDEMEYIERIKKQKELSDKRIKLHEELIKVDTEQIEISKSLQQLASTRIM
jgi:uncharacterized phage infection (PIP) family protein YhgE